MRFLLPYPFKMAGAWMTPLGFVVWLLVQLGYFGEIMTRLFGPSSEEIPYHTLTVGILMVSFFSFLFGLCFLTFSREKVEDEMVQKLRLESFQVAALVQIVVGVASFLLMVFVGEAPPAIMELFFLILILLFWLSYIIRFHVVLYLFPLK